MLLNQPLTTLRRALRKRDTRIYEFGPLVANWDGAVFLHASGFYRWHALWVGLHVEEKPAEQQTHIYLCCFGLGLKITALYRERSY